MRRKKKTGDGRRSLIIDLTEIPLVDVSTCTMRLGSDTVLTMSERIEWSLSQIGFTTIINTTLKDDFDIPPSHIRQIYSF